jgi:hypothetical protein
MASVRGAALFAATNRHPTRTPAIDDVGAFGMSEGPRFQALAFKGSKTPVGLLLPGNSRETVKKE